MRHNKIFIFFKIKNCKFSCFNTLSSQNARFLHPWKRYLAVKFIIILLLVHFYKQKQYCFWSNMTSGKEFMGLKQACFWSKNQAKAALLLVHFYKQKQYCFWSNMTSWKEFMGLKQACFWSKNQAKAALLLVHFYWSGLSSVLAGVPVTRTQHPGSPHWGPGCWRSWRLHYKSVLSSVQYCQGSGGALVAQRTRQPETLWPRGCLEIRDRHRPPVPEGWLQNSRAGPGASCGGIVFLLQS